MGRDEAIVSTHPTSNPIFIHTRQCLGYHHRQNDDIGVYALNLNPTMVMFNSISHTQHDASVPSSWLHGMRSFHLLVLEGRRPLHHQRWWCSFASFRKDCNSISYKKVSHPCLGRHVGNSASFLVWLRYSHTHSHPFSSFLAWFRLQRVVFVTVPNEFETWYTRKLPLMMRYTRKLPLTYCIGWRLNVRVFQMSWQCQVSPFAQRLPRRRQQK